MILRSKSKLKQGLLRFERNDAGEFGWELAISWKRCWCSTSWCWLCEEWSGLGKDAKKRFKVLKIVGWGLKAKCPEFVIKRLLKALKILLFESYMQGMDEWYFLPQKKKLFFGSLPLTVLFQALRKSCVIIRAPGGTRTPAKSWISHSFGPLVRLGLDWFSSLSLSF